MHLMGRIVVFLVSFMSIFSLVPPSKPLPQGHPPLVYLRVIPPKNGGQHAKPAHEKPYLRLKAGNIMQESTRVNDFGRGSPVVKKMSSFPTLLQFTYFVRSRLHGCDFIDTYHPG